MPYENYMTEQAFRDDCPVSGYVIRRLDARFNPNLWIFESGGKPTPQEKRYFFIFRNFDGSKRISVTYDPSSGGDGITIKFL